MIDVATGPSGTAAVLSTKSGDFLVLVHDGTSWTASVLDDGSAEIAGIEASDTVRLAGATIRGGVARPALFALDRSGEWVPRRVDVVPDDRNAGFQSASGDRLRDAFLDGRVLTGNVATAEVIAVRAGAGTWLEAAYPDAVSGQGQPPIAEVVQSGDDHAGDRRRSAGRRATRPFRRDACRRVNSFPNGAVDSVGGRPGVDRRCRRVRRSVCLGAGRDRRCPPCLGDVEVRRKGSCRRQAGGRRGQLELADLEVGRDGSLLGVGYESFVPANFDNFIEPYEFDRRPAIGSQPRPVGGDDRTRSLPPGRRHRWRSRRRRRGLRRSRPARSRLLPACRSMASGCSPRLRSRTRPSAARASISDRDVPAAASRGGAVRQLRRRGCAEPHVRHRRRLVVATLRSSPSSPASGRIVQRVRGRSRGR